MFRERTNFEGYNMFREQQTLRRGITCLEMNKL